MLIWEVPRSKFPFKTTSVSLCQHSNATFGRSLLHNSVKVSKIQDKGSQNFNHPNHSINSTPLLRVNRWNCNASTAGILNSAAGLEWQTLVSKNFTCLLGETCDGESLHFPATALRGRRDSGPWDGRLGGPTCRRWDLPSGSNTLRPATFLMQVARKARVEKEGSALEGQPSIEQVPRQRGRQNCTTRQK